MTKESMRKMLEAHGSFPERADVQANFDALFELAGQGAESPADLAGAFMQALDQWAHIDARSDERNSQRLREWALGHWSAGSYRLCEQLGHLLLNVATPQTLAFLVDQRAQAADPDVQRLLDALIAQHPAAQPAG